MTYSVIICEDNQLQLENLKTIIKNYSLFHGDLFPITLAATSPEAILEIVKNNINDNRIYFLDIDLNHKINGLDLAVEIRKNDYKAKIIFTTTMEEMAAQTFKRKIEALGYIIKDQNIELYRDEIHSHLEAIEKRLGADLTKSGKRFKFSVGSETYFINITDILYLKPSTVPHRLNLITKHDYFDFYGKLGVLEKEYPDLFRASRTYLINPENIQRINYKDRTIWFDEYNSVQFSLGKGKALKKIMSKR